MTELTLHYVTLVCIYGVIAIGLDVLVGQMRLLSVAQGAFVGIGGYVAAWAALAGGMNIYVCLCVSCSLSGIIAMLFGFMCRGLRGDTLLLAMLAFQMVLSSVFSNWSEVTGGTMGMAGITMRSFIGDPHVSARGVLAIGASSLLLFWLVRRRIADSPLGLVWTCLGEDEQWAASLGKDAKSAKITAIAVAGAVAGFGGALYAAYSTYVDPALFSVTESVMLLSMVIVGGAGTRYGPIVGAAIIILLPEALRYFAFSGVAAGPLRQATYGLLLIVIILWRPQGLVGRYAFERA